MISTQAYLYINTLYIHNASFRQEVPAAVMAQAQALANYNQWNLYSSPDLAAVENSASLDQSFSSAFWEGNL